MLIKKSVPTQTSPVYSFGDAIGSLMTITSSQLSAPSDYRLNSILVKDYTRSNFAGEAIFFDSYPAATSVTDNLPLTIPQIDMDRVCGVASIASNAYMNVSTMGMQFIDTKGQPMEGQPNIYAVLRAHGTATFGSASAVDLAFNFGE